MEHPAPHRAHPAGSRRGQARARPLKPICSVRRNASGIAATEGHGEAANAIARPRGGDGNGTVRGASRVRIRSPSSAIVRVTSGAHTASAAPLSRGRCRRSRARSIIFDDYFVPAEGTSYVRWVSRFAAGGGVHEHAGK
ncbi:MAG TPA: hypothetical protein VIN61_17595 [Gammaproteobacteria bacterium]